MEKSEFNALVEHYKNEMIELFNLKANTSNKGEETSKENQPENMNVTRETASNNENAVSEVDATKTAQEVTKNMNVNNENKENMENNEENNS